MNDRNIYVSVVDGIVHQNQNHNRNAHFRIFCHKSNKPFSKWRFLNLLAIGYGKCSFLLAMNELRFDVKFIRLMPNIWACRLPQRFVFTLGLPIRQWILKALTTDYRLGYCWLTTACNWPEVKEKKKLWQR